jgi:hypothetical protein
LISALSKAVPVKLTLVSALMKQSKSNLL